MISTKTKQCLAFRIFLIGCILFGTSYLVYIFDGRDNVDAYYGSCMMISLQGQDDGPENAYAKLLIGPLSVLSALMYSVSVWTYGERYFCSDDYYGNHSGNHYSGDSSSNSSSNSSNSHRLNLRNTVYLGIFLALTTFLTYMLIEERNFTDSFYGTCMLLSMQGQDEKPETDFAKLLIGLLSIISSFLFGIIAWMVMAFYIEKEIEESTYVFLESTKNTRHIDKVI